MSWLRPRRPARSPSSGCRSSCGPLPGRCSRCAAITFASTGRSTSTGERSQPEWRSTCPATSHARRFRSPRACGRAIRVDWHAFKAALYEAFFCEGEDISSEAQIALAAERAELDPAEAVGAAYDPTRIAQIAEHSGRGGARWSSRRSVALDRGRTRRTGAWGASSGCSPANRSSHRHLATRAQSIPNSALPATDTGLFSCGRRSR